MQIGILCHATFGGSARIATELALALAKKGHHIHLFTRSTPFDLWQPVDGIVLHQIIGLDQARHSAHLYTDWNISEFEAYLERILEVIISHQLDVLHFHYAVPFAFIAAEVKRRLGEAAPILIGTLHGTDVTIHGRNSNKKTELIQAFEHLDCLTTVSVSHAQLAMELFGIKPDVLPNFVDLSRFHPQVKSLPTAGQSFFANPKDGRYNSQRNQENKYFRAIKTLKTKNSLHSRAKIVHLSNFRPIKAVQSVAHIFLGIREQIEADLWLIGDGEEMAEVKSILESSPFKSDVYYWGLQNDVAPLLAGADLLLVTSLYESFCLAALEALSCGVPVLATHVGGLPELIEHGTTGYLFELGDHQQAVALAVNLLSDTSKLHTMKQAAYERAQRFGTEQIVPMYEELYRRAVRAKMRQS